MPPVAAVEALTKKKCLPIGKHFLSKLIAFVSWLSNVLISLWHVHTPLAVAAVSYQETSYFFKVCVHHLCLHHITD